MTIVLPLSLGVVFLLVVVVFVGGCLFLFFQHWLHNAHVSNTLSLILFVLLSLKILFLKPQEK
jgi:apolipoprotein N-acyltransferase